MSRVNPSQFEQDMVRLGKKIGDPIPKHLKSRPEPGEYGGIYDDKPAADPATAPVEHRVSEPKTAPASGGYQTRVSTPLKDKSKDA